MLRLRNLVTITQVPNEKSNRGEVLYFTFITDVEIQKSFENLTQTAKITLPRNLKYKNKNIYAGDSPLILRGDKVKIELGYLPKITTVFEGYVSRVSNNIPVEIFCEDSMFLLKQKIVKKKSYENATLSELLKDIIGDSVKYKNINAELGLIRVHEASVSYVLNTLRSKYGIYSFFQDNTLMVGLPFYEAKRKEVFLFERVIISSDLEYLRSEDVKVRINGILINSDNTRIEKKYGDESGDLRTIYQYGGTEEELDRVCNQKLTELNYTGYYGSFLTFLEPYVTPGDHAIINSYKMPERNGTYIIKSVETKCGVNGGRQKIELEQRIL